MNYLTKEPFFFLNTNGGFLLCWSSVLTESRGVDSHTESEKDSALSYCFEEEKSLTLYRLLLIFFVWKLLIFFIKVTPCLMSLFLVSGFRIAYYDYAICQLLFMLSKELAFLLYLICFYMNSLYGSLIDPELLNLDACLLSSSLLGL
jgi:hypothetical protein